jgi:HEAT repeat protein
MRGVVVLVAVCAFASPVCAEEADEALAKQLSQIVRDPREQLSTRVEAARTLAKLGPNAAIAVNDLVTVLERLRGREQEPLQEAIIETLGQIGAAAKVALPAFTRAAARSPDIDYAIKRAREAILTASDAQNLDALSKQLTSRDVGTRLRAAKALGDLGPNARIAVPALTAILTDTDGDVRRATITALRLIQPGMKPNEATIRAIAVDLKDPDANLRLLAVRSLGRIGSAAAIVASELEPLRMDPDADVRRATQDAIGRIASQP